MDQDRLTKLANEYHDTELIRIGAKAALHVPTMANTTDPLGLIAAVTNETPADVYAGLVAHHAWLGQVLEALDEGGKFGLAQLRHLLRKPATAAVSDACQSGRCANCWDDDCACKACGHLAAATKSPWK